MQDDLQLNKCVILNIKTKSAPLVEPQATLVEQSLLAAGQLVHRVQESVVVQLRRLLYLHPVALMHLPESQLLLHMTSDVVLSSIELGRTDLNSRQQLVHFGIVLTSWAYQFRVVPFLLA